MRVPRDEEWDDTSLDDYPTEDIFPRNITEISRINGPVIAANAERAVDILGNWIQETAKRTFDTNKEHGFYVDWYGNVIGIIEGDSRKIDFPPDYYDNRIMKFHSHPGTQTSYSGDDIRNLEFQNINGANGIITVPRGQDSFHLTYGVKTKVGNCETRVRLINTQLKNISASATEEWFDVDVSTDPNSGIGDSATDQLREFCIENGIVLDITDLHGQIEDRTV